MHLPFASAGPRTVTARARPGRLSALSVSHSKAVLCGAFVRARGARNSRKRRSPAPGSGRRWTWRWRSSGSTSPSTAISGLGRIVTRTAHSEAPIVRGTGYEVDMWRCRRAQSHCRFAPPPVRLAPDSLTCSVPVFLRRRLRKLYRELVRLGPTL